MGTNSTILKSYYNCRDVKEKESWMKAFKKVSEIQFDKTNDSYDQTKIGVRVNKVKHEVYFNIFFALDFTAHMEQRR